ncbi:hypothetical protein [Nocardia sp. Marseille-Q1738]
MQTRESELEGELEGELEEEFELEGEYEEEFEFEGEYEQEFEFEGEYEGEYEQEFELEGEYEGEYEEEFELEGEYEGEEFFRRLRRIVRNPVFRSIARAAVPMIATAVGGPAAGMVARTVASRVLRESELELEGEFELEGEQEGRPTRTQAAAEAMAAAASRARSEAEAEAYIGAATVNALSARDQRALAALLPHLVHGSAVLTRILRRRRATRPAVRAIPSIVRRTGAVLRRRAAAGRPVTPRVAGRVMAGQTRRVLGDPRMAARSLQQNVRQARQVSRPAGPVGTTGRGYPMRQPGGPARRIPMGGYGANAMRPVGR